MQFALNVLLSACVIATASWLSGRHPTLAGFFVALPLSTMLVLPLSYLQNGDVSNTFVFARSIFVAIPVSLLFFVPFLLAETLRLSFWTSYGLGAALLVVGFGLHRGAMWLLQSGT